MDNPLTTSDRKFLEQIRNCTLPLEAFTHDAHLRLAWINIHLFGLEKAQKETQHQLKEFATFVGHAQKYHATLTVAAVYIVHQFMPVSGAEFFADFLQQNPGLRTRFKDYLLQHYSKEVLESEEAKNQYVLPNLTSF